MRMYFSRFISLFFVFCLYSELVSAQSGSTVLDSDRANVCMNVSVRASIVGLEDFDLSTSSTSGSGGAVYTGEDYFELESNAPVYLMISGQPLTRGATSLETNYMIDGQRESVAIGGGGSHKGVHQIQASTQLGDISAQIAGEYTGAIVVTVIPQIPAKKSCNDKEKSVIDDQTAMEIDTSLSLETQRVSEDLGLYQEQSEEVVEVPEEFLWAVVSNDGLNLFPFLAEYLAWRDGQIDTLSYEARAWWLYQLAPRDQ